MTINSYITIHFNKTSVDIPERTGQLIHITGKLSSTVVQDSLPQGELITQTIQKLNLTLKSEPSIINTAYPLTKPRHPEKWQDIGYYPSYARLTSQERYLYVHWLKDVSNPIAVGYLFIYYYGLERRLLSGYFDLAFDEILHLLQFHKNASFQAYANSALLLASLAYVRKDRVLQLLDEGIIHGLSSLGLFARSLIKRGISAGEILDVTDRRKSIHYVYRTKYREELETEIQEILYKMYGMYVLPIEIVSDFKTDTRNYAFANYSFPDSVRFYSLPDLNKNEKLQKDIATIVNMSLTNVKQMLKRRMK